MPNHWPPPSLAISGVNLQTLVWWFIVSIFLAWKGNKALQPQTCFLRITIDIICIYIRPPQIDCNKLKISCHTSFKKERQKIFLLSWLAWCKLQQRGAIGYGTFITRIYATAKGGLLYNFPYRLIMLISNVMVHIYPWNVGITVVFCLLPLFLML